MMFLNMGVGLLANMIGQASAQRQSESMAKQFRTTLNQEARTARQQLTDPFGQRQATLDFTPPTAPQKATEKLAEQQQTNTEERQSLVASTRDEMREMKDSFFESRHLETEERNGKQEVVCREDGKPVVAKGPETKEQRVARETFEADKREQTSTRHEEQRQAFVQGEKEDVQAFLQQNKPDLGNPAVQQELQKMVMQSQKKALDLTRKQLDEDLKLDAYSEEQVALVDSKMDDLRQMEERHALEEDNSDEAKELLGYQQDLAEMLRQKREEAKEQNMQEMFLKGPPRFNQSNQATEKETDVAEVLPPYLSNALYNMGIYSV